MVTLPQLCSTAIAVVALLQLRYTSTAPLHFHSCCYTSIAMVTLPQLHYTSTAMVALAELHYTSTAPLHFHSCCCTSIAVLHFRTTSVTNPLPLGVLWSFYDDSRTVFSTICTLALSCTELSPAL
ncbi:Uncharacterised protein [Chlamydia abortus]|nr:Uncharacterised protein [Chlamydia abortus]